MRRIRIAMLSTLLLFPALLPFHRTNVVGAAVSEGERLSIYRELAAVSPRRSLPVGGGDCNCSRGLFTHAKKKQGTIGPPAR